MLIILYVYIEGNLSISISEGVVELGGSPKMGLGKSSTVIITVLPFPGLNTIPLLYITWRSARMLSPTVYPWHEADMMRSQLVPPIKGSGALPKRPTFCFYTYLRPLIPSPCSFSAI